MYVLKYIMLTVFKQHKYLPPPPPYPPPPPPDLLEFIVMCLNDTPPDPWL
jgi:hypothetical protein